MSAMRRATSAALLLWIEAALLTRLFTTETHESVGTSPVTAKAFAGAEAAIDLIYNPPKSAFLQLAEAQGLQIVNGEAMLFYQAYYADCLYLGISPGAQARALYQQYKRENR